MNKDNSPRTNENILSFTPMFWDYFISDEMLEKVDYTIMGKRLRHMREKNNITQEQLGEILNVSKQAISQMEYGKQKSLIWSRIRDLGEYFECTPHYLLGLTDREEDLITSDGKVLCQPIFGGDPNKEIFKVRKALYHALPNDIELAKLFIQVSKCNPKKRSKAKAAIKQVLNNEA